LQAGTFTSRRQNVGDHDATPKGAVGLLQDMAVLAGDILVSPIPPKFLSAREFARGTIGMLG
jgi:hypothetical protein